MSTRTFIIPVVAHHTDCGDGSFSSSFYNTREELAADLANDGSETTLEDIESGDDPYEHGTISESEIEIEFDDDTQTLKLGKSFHVNSDG